MEVLSKGQNLKLPEVQKAVFGLSWDLATSGQKVDCDAWCIALQDKEGKGLDSKHVVYYGNLKDPENAVCHSGDNLTGEGDGDDETITVDLTKLHPSINALLFGVTIYDAKSRKQNFGQVKHPKAKLYFGDDSIPQLMYEMDEDYSAFTTLHVCMLYKHNGEWKFKAVGEGTSDDLAVTAGKFGL